jgi:glycosyltransferase involved in cell wall biosynthesis
VSIDVLHVTYTYTPQALGGTEVYVRSLIQELQKLGVHCAIAAPGAHSEQLVVDGVPVWRVAAALDTDHIFGAASAQALNQWCAVLDAVAPRILHVHARTPSLHSSVLKAAKARGIRVLYTVHTPTSFCIRGTLLEFGTQVCDGKQAVNRCSACLMEKLGAPLPRVVSQLPIPLLSGLAQWAPKKWASGLKLKARVARFHREVQEFYLAADTIIPVCEWIAGAIQTNRFSAQLVPVNRQGLRSDFVVRTRKESARKPNTPLRLIAMGRADPAKGFDTLLRAVQQSAIPVELDVCLTQADADLIAYWRSLCDPKRARFHFDLDAEGVSALMDQCDVLAAPSTGLETGPLVVLEAFARGLPVLGSKRGGIQELVQDGVNGWLVEAGNVGAWRSLIEQLASTNSLEVEQARQRIQAPRSMQTVALEHLAFYRKSD